MPLVSPPHIAIEVAVSDRVVAGTTIRQKARFISLNHQQNPENGECSVKVTVEVTLYAVTSTGEFGPPLSGAGFTPYTRDLVGDNRSLVDLATGEIVANRTNESAADWAAIGAGFTQPVMGQGDYFEYAREHEELSIGDLIKTHIENADKPPYSRFA